MHASNSSKDIFKNRDQICLVADSSVDDSSPAAFHVGQDFIKLVLSHYERRENHSLGKVGVIADDDGASCTFHERACAIVKTAIVSRTEDDLPFVRTTDQTLWFTRTTAQKKEIN